MDSKQEVVHKPNQTIMITNKSLGAAQRKAYNIILYKAWHDLKINKDQAEFKLPIQVIKNKAGLRATDNKKLKNALIELKSVGIDTVKDNGEWVGFNLISSYEKEGEYVIVELPRQIRKALIDNDYYTTLDLLIIKNLEGKYAIILYEMAIRYCKKEIPEMALEELRLLTGTENIRSYDNFGLYRQKVLTPAIREINSDKTEIVLSYQTRTKAKKVVGIKFFVRFKNEQIQIDSRCCTDNENNIVQQADDYIVEKQAKDIVQAFFYGTGETLYINVVTNLINELGYDKVKEQLHIFLSLDKSSMRDVKSTFIGTLKKGNTFTESRIKVNQSNFQQRLYDDKYYEGLYNCRISYDD